MNRQIFDKVKELKLLRYLLHDCEQLVREIPWGRNILIFAKCKDVTMSEKRWQVVDA